MKALVYTGVENLEYRDVPMVESREEEVLIRIMASGICGSDMHAYQGHDERRQAPLILGHEAAGVIVGDVHDGKRVTINPLVTCGTCRDCMNGRTNLCGKRQIISMPPREGAFADYISMPFGNLVVIPNDVSFETAALTEPIACGWHAVRLGQTALGTDLASMRCLVIGGGAIGVGAGLSLAAFGAQDITLFEPNPIRRERLLVIDKFKVIDTADYDPSDKDGFDFVIDGVGFASTRATACKQVRQGGVICHIGLGDSQEGLDVRRMTLQEITFIGNYTYTADDFRETASAIFDGRLGALDWIEKRPLSEGRSAFSDIRAGSVVSPKIILIPEHQSC
jgi:L-gulonate 5-dehydrogenase